MERIRANATTCNPSISRSNSTSILTRGARERRARRYDRLRGTCTRGSCAAVRTRSFALLERLGATILGRRDGRRADRERPASRSRNRSLLAGATPTVILRADRASHPLRAGVATPFVGLARIGIGSNVGDSELAIDRACAALAADRPRDRTLVALPDARVGRHRPAGLSQRRESCSRRNSACASSSASSKRSKVTSVEFRPSAGVRGRSISISSPTTISASTKAIWSCRTRGCFERAFALAPLSEIDSVVSRRLRGAARERASGGAAARHENVVL